MLADRETVYSIEYRVYSEEEIKKVASYKSSRRVRRLSYDKRAHNGIQIIIYYLHFRFVI